jgi:regulator of nucleoside diphosphate kinase
MLHHPLAKSLPRIVVSEAEEHSLTDLATAAELTGRSQQVARALLAEMERAEVVPDREVPRDVVRMNSWVEFEIDGRNRRRVQIVFPGEANIDDNKISILTPIGTALIGLVPGQTMVLRGHDGRPHELRVLSVAQLVGSATLSLKRQNQKHP